MIAALKGTILKKVLNHVVIDVGGIGYQVFISLLTYSSLPDENHPVHLYIHTHVREDAIILFGFETEDERDIFLLLISISGIGPKLALAVLSGIAPGDLEDAVISGDVARITALPGIGKKTAERIVLELKEKIKKEAKEKRLDRETGEGVFVSDVIDALVNLGYQRTQAEGAVREVMASGSDTINDILRNSLKSLVRK